MILTLARGWLVYDMTRSPFLLGVVTGAFSIPVIVLALPGGAVTDRVNKRNLMIVTESIATFLSISIALLIATHLISVWQLVVASVLSGITFSFGQPAKQAIITQIAGRDKLMNAIALSSTGFNSMRIIAPAVGGFLLAVLGTAPVYFVGAALTLTGITFLLSLPRLGGDPERARRGFSQDMQDGIEYMYRNGIIRTLVLITIFCTLLAQPYQFMLPIFARDILRVEQVGLGWMMAMIGIGAVVGNLIIASLGEHPSKARLLLFITVAMGLLLAIFSFSTVYILSLFWLLLLGLCSSGFNTLANTMLQTYSSDGMRGRVLSVMTVAFGLGPLGAVPLGAVAQFAGAPFSLGLAGVLVVLAGVVIAIFHKAFRQLD